MAKALFHRNQKVWVESVGAWAVVERIVPVWAKGFGEPVRITYDVGLGREFLANELRAEDHVDDPAADAADLTIRCWLGERLVASDRTRNYVWDVRNAISHVTRTMTLLPGDVVSMGTAVGGDNDDPDAPDIPGVTRSNLVGFDGAVTVTISGLGTLSNPIQTSP